MRKSAVYEFGSLPHKGSSLTYIMESEVRASGVRMAYYMCECGTVTERGVSAANIGRTISCGCKNKNPRKVCEKTHGATKHPLYATWAGILSRCTYKGSPSYPNYGGAGISVCEEWSCPVTGFDKFYSDMGDKPSDDHTLDRIDNEKGYYKENCKWSCRREQSWNKKISKRNTSGRVGVGYVKATGRYRAYSSENRKYISLGTYDTIEEAIAVREEHEREIFGRTNPYATKEEN